MQIKIVLAKKNLKLTLAYQYYAQSMIYRMLGPSPGYSEFLHSCGYADGGKTFKLFTFGALKGSYRIEDKSIIFDETAELEIRSPETEFIQAVLTYLATSRVIELCGQSVGILSYKLMNRCITAENVVIKMLSPVTVYKTEGRKTIYFTPGDDRFYELIAKNFRQKYKAASGSLPDGEAVIAPVRFDPVKDKRVTLFKDTYITAWNGIYSLNACPEHIDFLYNTGIGSKNSQGFGMFEPV